MSKYHRDYNKSKRHDKKEHHEGEFSYQNNKSDYDYLLLGNDNATYIVEDKKDFWNFVVKYEKILQKTGPAKIPVTLSSTQLEEFLPFHKRKFIALDLCSTRKANGYENYYTTKEEIFRNIILIYLDFKQKEKFAKIKKLRKSQSSLPIAQFKNTIEQALAETRVIIIAGDTGCGKSTQVPQYLYKYGYRKIACTQPRRLACVSLSQRVSHEMLSNYTNNVGFQIRFESRKNSHTNIVFITEGLLLRQLVDESKYDQYEVLILDEIHERNLFGDFLLGVTKCLLQLKPNMKLILMSATINVQLFQDYFEDVDAHLITVPGRLFPIKTLYMPPPKLESAGNTSKHKSRTESARMNPAPFIDVLRLIDQKYNTIERGDVLIFVSGVNEILSIHDAAREYGEENSHWIILPLHSGLSLAEQDKVFDYAPDGMRKCIIATNIAETSLTVDGIRFVVDSGKVKEMSYDAACKGQRLKEFWVSKASAEQRKGRAGRTGPGTCYRLFSEKQYELFEPFSTPQIFRVPLDSILLQMVAMGLHNVRLFPFIEKPEEENIEQTILSLKQHNALTENEQITSLGRTLANLPVDMSIGKLLLRGSVFPNTEQILTLAAIMSVQNPFLQRGSRDVDYERAREKLRSDQGDIFTLLSAFCEWLENKLHRENTSKWCHRHGIEEQRFYEITKLRSQFHNILEQCNFIRKIEENKLTKSERSRRHGEVQMLKAIKRKQRYQEPRQRKILKQHKLMAADGDEEFNKNPNDDVRDVEFRLNFDSSRIEMLYKSAKIKAGDEIMAKLIICSGLYPQIAIADEFNYCKGGGQQFYHTRLKPFVSMYPNEHFAQHYEQLKLSDSDILSKPPYYTPKQALSDKHQILCFQNLVETVKPYLMNCIQMPAAQTLLLFSHTLDTNAAISEIVCDSWLLLDFPTPETGFKLLCRALELRSVWNKLLDQKLNAGHDDPHSGCSSSEDNQNIEIQLRSDLIDYMRTNISYSIKRLLPADSKTMYKRGTDDMDIQFQINPFEENFDVTQNTEKGGYNVSANVTYACLNELEWTRNLESIMAEQLWQCAVCDISIPMNTLKKVLHKKVCSKSLKSKEKQKPEDDKKPNVGEKKKISHIDLLRQRKLCS